MYNKKLHIHFIGIGGIGMSALATILKQSGYSVSGCDPDISQETVTQLKLLGCPVYHGNNSPACADNSIDIAVYIPMYKSTIPAITAEINRARSNNIITVSRAQMLAELMRTKYSIAVTGSHGKTTTSGLIAHIFMHANRDPSIAVGGHISSINSHGRYGNGDFFIAEADESDRSLLQLNPTVAVVTNIDLEHLETYTDLDDIKNTFLQFTNKVPFYGKAIVCTDDENIRSLLPHLSSKIITYGIEFSADIYAKNIVLEKDMSRFTLYVKNNSDIAQEFIVPIAGIHNVYNALGAIAASLEVGILLEVVQKGIASFTSIKRRFYLHGTYKGAALYDDYGHHPKEIELTLLVARKKALHKLIVIFQPHRYTRTEKLWGDFASTFATSLIDTLVITDIYSAGEAPIENITSKRLVDELKQINPNLNVHHIPFSDDFKEIKDTIAHITESDDLILFLGAGRMHLIPAQLITQ